ncbi:hypothetical protein WYI_06691 [Ochrobactrum sp. CDB2]|jgi:hypothetical protein|nr:hypothetical protein WYI_06691 [Ochrobactrum sp. CDB2]GLU29371.1 hypothetical protein Brsp01_46040 [Brucella sp. NBRC 12950]
MPDLSNQKCAMTGAIRAELFRLSLFAHSEVFTCSTMQKGFIPAQSAPGDADNRKNAYCARAA